MIQSIKHISIPEPCSQNWNDMTPSTGGRHCDHCCKTVTDFTAMTNQQIIDILSNTGNICGRFDQPQLRDINLNLQQDQNFSWKRWWLAASLLFALPACKSMGEPRLTGKVIRSDTTYRIINGTIRDSTDKLPVPGVTISVKGTKNIAYTNMSGKFSIKVSADTGILEAHFIGYKEKEIRIDTLNNKTCDMELAPENFDRMVTVVAGGVFVRYSFFRRMYNKLIKWPAKKIFG